MKILFISLSPISPAVGGVQRVTENIALELQKRGHEVAFFSYQYEEDLKYDKFVAKQYFIKISGAISIAQRQELRNIVDEFNPDIIVNQNLCNNHIIKEITCRHIITVCHTQPFPDDSLTRSRILRTPAIGFRQSANKIISFIIPALKIHYSAKIEKKNLIEASRLSDVLCFISDKFYCRVEKHIPSFPKEKMYAIPNPNTFVVTSENKTKQKIILWIGRVENDSKNLDDFLLFWDKFSRIKTDWHSLVIGGGTQINYYKNIARKRNMKNIMFTGMCNNIKEYYEIATFSIITSWSESWCMVITESMCNGCIPICYDTFESLHDIIDDSINGYIANPTPDSLLDIVSKAIANPQKIELMARNAKEKAKLFSIEKIVDQWEILFKRVLFQK